MTDEMIIDHLAKTNDPQYNLLKAAEELSELTEALLKRLTKGERGASDDAIIEEIGDVQIRIGILGRMFGYGKVVERIEGKLKKYKSYVEEGKYDGRI